MRTRSVWLWTLVGLVACSRLGVDDPTASAAKDVDTAAPTTDDPVDPGGDEDPYDTDDTDDTATDSGEEPDDTAEPEPAPCESAPGVPGDDVTLSLEWEGRTRTYNVHLPIDYDCTPRPVVIGLHYYTGTAENFEHETAQLHDFLNDEGVIGIFPQAMARGSGAADDWVTAFNDISSHNDDGPDGETCEWWSWDYGVFDDCGPEETERFCRWGTSCADDVGLMRQIIADASATWTVDPDRIHLTGFSQGGIATQTWAYYLEDILASVAPLHGFAANGHTIPPNTGVSMMQVWGVYDFAINGWETSSTDGLIYDGAAETAADWALVNRCNTDGGTAYETVSDGVWGMTCTQHDNCDTGADVVTCQWDGTHLWGRSDSDGDFMWAAVWEFFEAHPKVR